MSAYQWLLSQQDNYGGKSNLVKEFINDLYLNFSSSSFCYILHDKEKDLHCHCILVLNVALTKKQLLNIFPYADIEIQKGSNKSAWLYLLHKTKKAIAEGKYQYDEKDIIYNSFDDFDEWLEITKESSKNKSDIELLDLIVDDIISGSLTTFREVLSKYKGVALKYSRSIQDLLDNFK